MGVGGKVASNQLSVAERLSGNMTKRFFVVFYEMHFLGAACMGPYPVYKLFCAQVEEIEMIDMEGRAEYMEINETTHQLQSARHRMETRGRQVRVRLGTERSAYWGRTRSD